MTTYVAWLRGINVGGTNSIPMKELRAQFERLGHEKVETYVRSGNVVFEGKSPPKKIGAEIEDAVSKAFKLRVSVILRTRRELEGVATSNPFLTEDATPSSLHVMFLAQSPSAKGVKALDPDRSPPDEFEVGGREVYLRFPNGSGRSKLTIDYFERKLGTRATARNWNTIMKVLELMRGA